MAPCRVIEDSDEDNGDFASPKLLSPSAVHNGVVGNSMLQSSSTDPMLFRAMYEEHLGQLPDDDPIPSGAQSPTLEDPIFNQRMSSSLSIPSARKLKRSKTINISSLSSITEPTLSNRKVIRTELKKAVDDLTQLTPPCRSREATRNDPWEVPSSNASDKAIGGPTTLKSKNSERNINRKTYGRLTRRSQTVTYSISNTPYDRGMSSPMEDDSPQLVTRNMQLQDQEGDDSNDSESKRHKRMRLNKDEVLVTLPEEFSDQSRKGTRLAPGDHTSKRIETAPHKPPGSMNEKVENIPKIFNPVFPQDLSSPPAKTQKTPDALVEDFYPATKSSVTQASPLATRFIVVMPDILSEEQKSQYDVVSIASTTQSSRSSQAELIAKMTSDEGCTRDSGTEGNSASPLASSSDMMEDLSRTMPSSLSLPVSAANRKMKRANSEVTLKKIATQTNSKVLKRKARSKTIDPTDKVPRREASVDELCVTSIDSVQKITSEGGLARNRKSRALCENEEDRMRKDELHNHEENRSGSEPHETRSGSHQPQNFSTQELTDSHAGLTNDTIEESSNTARKQAYAPSLESTASGLVQPKRRGRKKTSEIIAAKAISVTDTSDFDSVSASSKDHEIEPRVLFETDCNKQPLQQPAVTPPAKISTADIDNKIPAPAQTPTRDSKNPPEQHSPLQSGKMPYRVGLSKKTRIAPLLKMIRK